MVKIGPLFLFFFLLILFVGPLRAHSNVQNEESPYDEAKFSFNYYNDVWNYTLVISKSNNNEMRIIRQDANGMCVFSDSGDAVPQSVWDDIQQLSVQCVSSRHPFSNPLKTFQLNTVQFLQNLPLTNVHSVTINLEGYYGKAEVNFSHWKMYSEWKEKKRLCVFKLKSDFLFPKFDITALYGFNLSTLEVPCYLTEELLYFPELEYVRCYGVYSNMTQQLVELKHLRYFDEYQRRYDNSFENLHAERYYRTLLTSSKHLTKIKGVPFAELLSLHEPLWEFHGDGDNNSKRLIRDTEVLIFENDYPNYSGKTPENDTLMAGEIKRGKLKGIWTFKFKDQYARNDREKHRVNFNRLPKLKFPENGTWTLEYSNGNSAIEGSFKKGRKNGEWMYYNEDGTLRSTKTYRNDTLIFNKVQFNLHGNNLESRTYYASMNEIYQSIYFPDEQKVKLNVLYYDGGNPAYRVNSNGLVAFRKKGEMYAQNISKTSEKYQTLIREGIIDKLFPEYRNQELPFIVE